MTEDQEDPSDSVPPHPPDAPATQEAVDRRRQGRLKHVSPELVPLLRFKPSAEQMAAPQEHPDEALPAQGGDDEVGDDSGIMRDIAFGLLLSIPFWVALAVFWLLG